MPIKSPQIGVNSLHQSIIDLRARLIAHEKLFDKATQSMLKSMYQDWEKFLQTQALAGYSKWDYPKALAARRLAILKGIGKITGTSIAKFQHDIASRAMDVFKSQYYRHASLLDSFLNDSQRKQLEAAGLATRSNAGAAIAFHKIDEGAVKAALADPITGVMKASVVKSTAPVFTNAARSDLAKTIAEGKGVDDLLGRWQKSVNLAGHNPRAVARTALMSASQQATGMLYAQNKDIISAMQWEATFDNRTCVVCGSLHGRQYPINDQPPMPAHLQCRCTLLPIFADASLNEPDVQPKTDQWGNVNWAKGDRRFEAWMRKQPPEIQYQFFGSKLKHKAWRNGWVNMNTLVKPDLSIMSDAELTKLLSSGEQTPTKVAVQRAVARTYPAAKQKRLESQLGKPMETVPVEPVSHTRMNILPNRAAEQAAKQVESLMDEAAALAKIQGEAAKEVAQELADQIEKQSNDLVVRIVDGYGKLDQGKINYGKFVKHRAQLLQELETKLQKAGWSQQQIVKRLSEINDSAFKQWKAIKAEQVAQAKAAKEAAEAAKIAAEKQSAILAEFETKSADLLFVNKKGALDFDTYAKLDGELYNNAEKQLVSSGLTKAEAQAKLSQAGTSIVQKADEAYKAYQAAEAAKIAEEAAKAAAAEQAKQKTLDYLADEVKDLHDAIQGVWLKHYQKTYGYKSVTSVAKKVDELAAGLKGKLQDAMPESEINKILKDTKKQAKKVAKKLSSGVTEVGGEAAVSQALGDSALSALDDIQLPRHYNDLANLKKIDGPKGSNPGQWYQAADGSKYFVKTVAKERANYEVAAGLYYEHFGVNVARTGLVELEGGEVGIISKFVPNLEAKSQTWWSAGNGKLARKAAQQHYMHDVAMSNWDVVGLSYDNMLVDDLGRVWRIDAGGSMKFRAQGGLKPTWGRKPDGWVSDFLNMKNPSVGKQAGQVFGEIDDKQAEQMIRQWVADVSDKNLAKYIRRMERAGIDKAVVDDIAAELVHRRGQAQAYLDQLAQLAKAEAEMQAKIAKGEFVVIKTPSKVVANGRIIDRDDELRSILQRVLGRSDESRIRDFTGAGSSSMRKLRRDVDYLKKIKESDLSPADLKRLKTARLLDKTLAKIPEYTTKSDNEFLWRGLSFGEDNFRAFMNNILATGEYHVTGPESFSTIMMKADNFDGGDYGVVLKVIPKGGARAGAKFKKMHPVAPVSSHSSENEVISQFGKKFKVRAIRHNADVDFEELSTYGGGYVHSRKINVLIELEEI